MNPLGLCHFYHTKPPYSNVITSPKSAAGACKIKCLLEKVKDLGQPFTIIVFEGGNVPPLGLLQELHSRLTLLHIPIFTPDKAKLGQKTRISCCPICTSVVKNNSAFLNHIVICHFLLWKMPQIHHVIWPADEEAPFEVSWHQGCVRADGFSGQQVIQATWQW